MFARAHVCVNECMCCVSVFVMYKYVQYANTYTCVRVCVLACVRACVSVCDMLTLKHPHTNVCYFDTLAIYGHDLLQCVQLA